MDYIVMAAADSSFLDSITVSQVIAIIAGLAVIVVPIIKLFSWALSVSREMDGKVSKSECEKCKQMMETFKAEHSAKLEAKAAKAEVENLMYRLGEQANSLTEIKTKFETELKNISEKIDSLTRSIERLIDHKMGRD